MLGITGKSSLIELSQGREERTPEFVEHDEKLETDVYSAYFGFGYVIELGHRNGVFDISPAGLALGDHMTRTLQDRDLTGRFLELGTGSGALALLLRNMGAANITATDISKPAVELAAENELKNFSDCRIAFCVSDLFSSFVPGRDRFDWIIFNPPGWRTPSTELQKELANMKEGMDSSAMFFGDDVLLRFFTEVPEYLTPNGRVLVGVNSLIGIQDVLQRYKQQFDGPVPLRFRPVERHTFPLFLYNQWEELGSALRTEFSNWRDNYGSAYAIDSRNNIFWSYEVIECQLTEVVKI